MDEKAMTYAEKIDKQLVHWSKTQKYWGKIKINWNSFPEIGGGNKIGIKEKWIEYLY
jgi:hypothetical protein